MPISIFKPTIKRRDMDAVLTSLVEDRLGPGARSEDLVRQCSLYLEVSGGLALREYRRAVDMALDAIEVEDGQNVVISPLAPRMYYDALSARGIAIRYADVELTSACLSAKTVAKCLDQRTAACIVDSPMGYVPDLASLVDMGIPVIEDVTTSIGSNCLGRKCGSFGRYTILGLEESGMITAGGGAIVFSQTKRDLGVLRKHVDSLDKTYLLCDVNASLASAQLKAIEEFITRRRDIAAIFTRALMKGKHRSLAQEGDSENVFYSFPVVLEGGVKEAMKYARSKKVPTKEAFSETTAGMIDFADVLCPNAQALSMRCILFPLYPMLTKDQVEQIARVLSTLP
jgi:perosamine synthetase